MNPDSYVIAIGSWHIVVDAFDLLRKRDFLIAYKPRVARAFKGVRIDGSQTGLTFESSLYLWVIVRL
jgi:hypothetical protein